MCRILYIDVASLTEHYNYNAGILRNVPNDIHIDICIANGYDFKDIDIIDKCYIIPESCRYRRINGSLYNSLWMRWRFFLTYKWVRNNIDLNKYDILFFSYTDVITFCLTFNVKLKCRVIFADHSIGDLKNNGIKYWFLRHLRKDFEVIAFEEYIKKYIEDELKLQNRIWIMKHPLPLLKNNRNYEENENSVNKFCIYAPASSNDEEFIGFLLERKDTIPKDVSIEIKSKIKSYESEILIVYSRYILNKEYTGKLQKCDCVLIHYGNMYNYRTSGVFFEAVKLRKPVVLYCGNTMKYYSDTYKEVVYGFENNFKFLDEINKIISFCKNVRDEDFDRILFDYGDGEIKNQFVQIIANKFKFEFQKT